MIYVYFSFNGKDAWHDKAKQTLTICHQSIANSQVDADADFLKTTSQKQIMPNVQSVCVADMADFGKMFEGYKIS
jgi:hypothetical protein